ncbi:MAG TPA: sulfite exporter TauE/SafE family protein, partial [Gammaproteobacteria bacterium]
GYNAGRLASYAAAGALAGALGEALVAGSGLRAARWLLQGLAAGFMLLLGLYLAGWWPLLARLERLGWHLWRRLEPLGRRWLPVRDPLAAVPLGLLWGWLPCGLVYSALAWSASAGGALAGAGLMLAFGAGTLPSMLAAGALAQRWRQLATGRLRVAAGVLVLALGVAGLVSVGLQVAGSGDPGHAASAARH